MELGDAYLNKDGVTAAKELNAETDTFLATFTIFLYA